jgi:uncharacterized protein YjdB
VSVNPATLSLTAGGATGSLTASLVPANATNQAVTWGSSNNNVATGQPSGNGLGATVTPVAPGTVNITVTASDTTNGTKTATCTVTVVAASVPVTGVTLSLATMNLAVGGAAGALAATIEPANATNQAVTWGSSNNNIATVQASGNGLTATVTPIAIGKATITVTAGDTTNGTKRATCAVTVAAWASQGVYVAGFDRIGYSGNRVATLWVDGVSQPLSSVNNTYANSVFVSGDDVYVAGEGSGGGSDGARATLWKNGVAQQLIPTCNQYCLNSQYPPAPIPSSPAS